MKSDIGQALTNIFSLHVYWANCSFFYLSTCVSTCVFLICHIAFELPCGEDFARSLVQQATILNSAVTGIFFLAQGCRAGDLLKPDVGVLLFNRLHKTLKIVRNTALF